MQTETLINQAKRSMTRYACRNLYGEEREEMQRLVERFFAEQTGNLSESEIMQHMATPMQALAWFNPFLCQTFWNHCCTGTMPQDADTCEMA